MEFSISRSVTVADIPLLSVSFKISVFLTCLLFSTFRQGEKYYNSSNSDCVKSVLPITILNKETSLQNRLCGYSIRYFILFTAIEYKGKSTVLPVHAVKTCRVMKV